jgi:hypothetical protein
MEGLLSVPTLDQLRKLFYGTSTILLIFYKLEPNAVEQQIATLRTGFHCWGLGGLPPGSIKIAIGRGADITVANLLENAAVDVVVNGQAQRYRIVGLNQTQELGAGWIIRADPVGNTI